MPGSVPGAGACDKVISALGSNGEGATVAAITTTHDIYVWCGPLDGWCYCFNVLDIFTRQWIAYRFDTLATASVAVESLVKAVAAAKPDCSKLTLQCDNGSQYAGKRFRKAASILGISLKFIRIHTPEQNGHIEAFHGTLKREYIWPHDFANYQQAEAVIAEAFRDYNRNRLHSALKYVPRTSSSHHGRRHINEAIKSV